MIRNERQYRITKARLEEFERALADVAAKTGTSAEDNLWLKVQQDAIASQMEELRADVQDYETLRAKGLESLEVASFDDIPRALVKARIALGLTQKDVADRLGLKEQQIQRYEATDYAGASLERVKQIMAALGLRLAQGVFLPSSKITLAEVFGRTRGLGLSREFVQDRLLPSALQSRLRAGQAIPEHETELWAAETVSRLGRIFSWPAEQIISGAALSVRGDVLAAARFKVPAGKDQQSFAAYAVYAHYLSLLLLQATAHIPQPGAIPDDAELMRKVITGNGEAVTLDRLLSFCWKDLGIPILPLNDPGAFHGACWKIKGRSVVVLKQRTSSTARWIIDLLHELRHLGNHQHESEFALIEPEQITKSTPADLLDEETEATEFAGEVALHGRAEELVDRCVRLASGKVEWLKTAVQRVAKEEHIGVELLANYLAYRLSLQDINWWGTAQNLQEDNGNPWRVVRDYALLHADLDKLNSIDKELLTQALSEPSSYAL
jgi:transcriptional regulator with XRE-family HTH domain